MIYSLDSPSGAAGADWAGAALAAGCSFVIFLAGLPAAAFGEADFFDFFAPFFFAAFDLDFVGQNDPDMAGAFADRAGASSGLGLKALRGGTFPNYRLLDDEIGDVQVVVILGVGDGAGKRLADEAGGFFGHKARADPGRPKPEVPEFPA